MANRMAMEQKIDAMVEKLDKLDGKVSSLDQKISTLDEKFTTLDGKVSTLDGKVTQLDGKVSTVDGKVSTLDGRVSTLAGSISDLKTEMRIQFDETHRLLKFGLEAREALRENMEGRFAAVDRKHDQEIGLLKDVLRSVAARRRAPRRR